MKIAALKYPGILAIIPRISKIKNKLQQQTNSIIDVILAMVEMSNPKQSLLSGKHIIRILS